MLGQMDLKDNPNAITDYLEKHFKEKEKMKKQLKMMGGDQGHDLKEKIREMEELGSVDSKGVQVSEFKRRKQKVMEQSYM